MPIHTRESKSVRDEAGAKSQEPAHGAQEFGRELHQHQTKHTASSASYKTESAKPEPQIINTDIVPQKIETQKIETSAGQFKNETKPVRTEKPKETEKTEDSADLRRRYSSVKNTAIAERNALASHKAENPFQTAETEEAENEAREKARAKIHTSLSGIHTEAQDGRREKGGTKTAQGRRIKTDEKKRGNGVIDTIRDNRESWEATYFKWEDIFAKKAEWDRRTLYGNGLLGRLQGKLANINTKVFLRLNTALIAAVIVVIAAGITGTSPMMALGTLFSGYFDLVQEDGTILESNVDEFLGNENMIPRLRENTVAGITETLSGKLKENGGDCDIVRVQVAAGGTPVPGTPENINVKFYPVSVCVEMMKPVFNAIVVAEKWMELGQQEGAELAEEIYESMYGIDYILSTEYCGQESGSGTGQAAEAHSCGYIHALADCPNTTTGTHTTYTCSACDTYVCAGHKGVLNCTQSHRHTQWSSATSPGCYTTIRHTGTDARNCGAALSVQCRGYSYCDGHTVCTAVLNMTGLNELKYKYFEAPIEQLKAKGEITEEEKTQLQNLQFGLELCDAFTESAPVFYGGEGFMTPVRFDNVASPFGWRLHPIYGDWRLHAGIDLSAASGTPIYASKDGTVLASGYNSSAGYHVVIDHGEGFTTVYMHMTYYVVNGGERVTQGQVIGYVGSTGDSTGPHLHFEIRKDGDSVNPEQYIDLNWKPGNPPKTGNEDETEESTP